MDEIIKNTSTNSSDTFKVIIAGGRDYYDYNTLTKICDHMLKNKVNVEIVSGGAKGADAMGEIYAYSRGYKLTKFPADWENEGRSAGYKRNALMAHHSDALIAFWDGRSKGTKHMIDLATAKGLKVKISYYNNN
jgi:hypothetical protein